MTDNPIDLNRGEVRELWTFVAEVRETLRRVEIVLTDHEERIRSNHEELVTQRSERAFTRWILPVAISIGAFVVAMWGMIRRNGV